MARMRMDQKQTKFQKDYKEKKERAREIIQKCKENVNFHSSMVNVMK